MSSFDNKEKAEENKYARDKEVEFTVYAKYHSLLADWVAQKLHLHADKAKEYKNALVTQDLNHHNDAALLEKIKHDFKIHDVNVAEQEIRHIMHELLQKAKKEKHGN